MLKKMYSVYDVKTSVYGTVMVLLTDGEALRVMSDTVKAKGNMISDHPADFRLDFLGEIDLTTGRIYPLENPRHIVDIAQLVEVKEVK